MAGRNIQKSSQTRLWLIEDRAGPGHAPSYQSLARATAIDWPQGDLTPIRIPDPDQYSKFQTIEMSRGQQGLPTITVESRLTRDASSLLELVRKGCAFDVQIHAGVCEDPRNFNGGWEKAYVIVGGQATGYSTGELGALDSDQDNPVNETVPISGLDYFELSHVNASELAATAVVQEVLDVVICDSKQCGECGIASDGCQVIFAITTSAGGSPGLAAEIIYSEDGGSTVGDTNVTTLAANENPNALACVGINLIVISEDSESLHYASVADILDGVETWAEVTTGFSATRGPQAIFSASATETWIAAEGGYIYFTDDPTSGVEIQSSGGATTQNLNAIHGLDDGLHVVAVGNSNAVIYTEDAGATWTSVTGPDVGVNLNAVWMLDENVWLVGTAGGKLWYTENQGATWTEKAFPGSGTGVVRDISFAGDTGVGYLAHDTTAVRGRILRTINGGFSWYVLPEKAGLSIPLNDKINAVFGCAEDPNTAYAGGLADNATDGILLKIS